jgi:HAD superfamily hydrolase (TIGR01484 family)
MKKRFIVFDLDGTLTESKSKITSDSAYLLSTLARTHFVGVASGAKMEQFRTQVTTHLPKGTNLRNVFYVTANGTKNYWFNGMKWNTYYPSHELTPREIIEIVKAFEDAAKVHDWMNVNPDELYGPQIENRESQVTFSALGQRAPPDIKRTFDPDFKKRQVLREFLVVKLPQFDIKIGGMTSVDVIPKNIDKVYGIMEIMRHIDVRKEEVLYVGDALMEGGNDRCVLDAGFDCISVSNPSETKMIIARIIYPEQFADDDQIENLISKI